MNDHQKTRNQLIAEIDELRRRIALMDQKSCGTEETHYPQLHGWAERAASAVFIFKDSRFLYTNPAMSRLTGYTRQELLEFEIWTLIHPDFQKEIRDRVSAWSAGERVPARSEFKVIIKGGAIRWINADSTFVNYEGRLAALTVAFDSTEHKLAENALRDSEERYRNIVEIAQEGIWVVDAEAITTYVNQNLAEMFGYSRDDMVGRSVFDFVDQASKEETRRLLEKGKQGLKWRHDFRFVRQDGSDLWTMVSTTPLFDNTGCFAGGLAMVADVTERYMSEIALRESEQRFRTLVGSMDDIVTTVDRAGRYTAFFGRGIDNVGRKADEFTGKTTLEILGERGAQKHEDAIARALAGEQVVFDWSSVSNEQKRHFQMRFSPIRDESDEVIGLVGVGRDITDKKRAEDSIRFQATLLDQVKQAVIATTPQGSITYLNKFAEETYGWSASEALNASLVEVIASAESRNQVFEILSELREGYVWSGEFLARRKDNTVFPATIISSPIFDEQLNMVGVVHVSYDITERKKAEDALRASEERYRDLVENARDIIYSHDLSGNYTSVNKAGERITGYTEEEALRMNFTKIVAPECIETARSMISAKLAGQKETVYDLDIIARDGRRVKVEVNSRLVHENGVPVGIQGIARDITERKRAVEALRVSEAHLQAILDHCPPMIFQKDLDGRYLQVNRQFERTFNLSSRTAIGKTDLDLFGSETGELFRTTDRMVLNTGRSIEFEDSRIQADGLHTYIVHKFPLVDSNGLLYAVGGISTDITERKLAEDEVRRQKEILQRIFDHIPVMIRFLDENGKIRLVNREWERTLGWTLQEIDARQLNVFKELYPDEKYRLMVMRAIEASTGEFANFQTRTKDGRLIDTSFANIRLGDGTRIGIGRDITEPKKAADLLKRQTAQLAALHEIELEISAESDLSRVLEVITRRAADLLDASHCSTLIREGDEDSMTIVASLDSSFVGLQVPAGDGMAGRVLSTGEIMIVEDYSGWGGRVRRFDQEAFGPAICTPLKWQKKVIGALSLVRFPGWPGFTREDASLLEQLAAEGTIAIHHAKLFNEVQEGQKRMKVLSHRLIDAQEAERKRLARELHDQIGQALTAVQINLQALQTSRNGTSAVGLEDCLAVIDSALRQVHDLSLDLRPSLLDDLGLVAALRWYVDRVANRAGIVRCFEADVLEERLSPEVETTCFRIAQEAMTNVLRHARAGTVAVQIRQVDSQLRLMVRDDGIGFDVGAAMNLRGLNESLGLQGMLERAAALGGVVDIRSQRGAGTEIQVSFPLTVRQTV